MRVINLSSIDLTVDQTSLLHKGLYFCRFQKGDVFEIVKGIYVFTRKLVLQVLHNRKLNADPLGLLGDWSSLSRQKYQTLRDLIDLCEEGHVDQDDDLEDEFSWWLILP